MKPKTREIITNIVIIKINLMFMIIFAGGLMYAAEMLGEAIRLREIFFWSSILLMIVFHLIKPIHRSLDKVEEMINKNKKLECEDTVSGIKE